MGELGSHFDAEPMPKVLGVFQGVRGSSEATAAVQVLDLLGMLRRVRLRCRQPIRCFEREVENAHPAPMKRARRSPIDTPIDSATPWRTIQDEPGCLNAA